MNNRGKPLSHLELLKNRLIFLSTRFDVDEHERGRLRRTINDSWKTAYHFLGKNQKRPLPDDRFLATQFLLYLGKQDESAGSATESGKRRRRQVWRLHHQDDEYKAYLLDKYFTPRNLPGVPQDPAAAPDETESALQRPTLTPQLLHDYAHDLKSCVEIYCTASPGPVLT